MYRLGRFVNALQIFLSKLDVRLILRGSFVGVPKNNDVLFGRPSKRYTAAQKIFVLLVVTLDNQNFGDKIFMRGDGDENPRSLRLARLQSGGNTSTKIFSDKIQVAQRYR